MSQEKNPFFSDDEYYENLEVPPANKKSSKEEEKSPIEKTFDTANDCRKFETEFFWQRGTYYWAFILASFTAHFACMGKFFDGKPISFCDIKDLPDFSLLALAVTAFFLLFLLLCMGNRKQGLKVLAGKLGKAHRQPGRKNSGAFIQCRHEREQHRRMFPEYFFMQVLQIFRCSDDAVDGSSPDGGKFSFILLLHCHSLR